MNENFFEQHQYYILDENGDANITQRLDTPYEVLEALMQGLDVAVIELSNFEWVDTLTSKNYGGNHA